ncbi:hypothetical protein THAOC_05978, partial [Thalassiosira oceanica]
MISGMAAWIGAGHGGKKSSRKKYQRPKVEVRRTELLSLQEGWLVVVCGVSSLRIDLQLTATAISNPLTFRVIRSIMKLSILATLVAGAAAFAPSAQGPQTTALNAQMGRMEFIAAASASVFAAAP